MGAYIWASMMLESTEVESAYSSRGYFREWSAVGGEKDRFCWSFFFIIVLWSYRRKICLNMCHGNSKNSDGCSYLLRICFICGTNVSVSQSWISLQVVDHEQCVECAFWFTNKRMQIKILSILKLVSFDSLANDFSERGTQAEARCERNPDHQLWSTY